MTALTDEARMHVYASKSKRMARIINHIQKVGYAGRKEIRESKNHLFLFNQDHLSNLQNRNSYETTMLRYPKK